MALTNEQHGVKMVELTLGHRSVFVYLIDGMLIDTGPVNSLDEMIPFYYENYIEFVCLTHSHEDHSGTGPWIEENLKVPIFAHKKAIPICRQPGDYPRYRQKLWGIRDGFHAEPLKDVIQTKHYTWKVIETPGHADDHVSFYNQDTGILFSGDLFVAPKTKVIMDTESIPETMASLKRLLAYDFTAMFCGHAGYVEDGKRMLQMKLDDLENISGEIIHRYEQGYAMEEIRKQLFPKQYPLIDISNHEWDSMHIVRSVINAYHKGEQK